jgi:membrane-associated protease RseP (regulator of RpoE activity)
VFKRAVIVIAGPLANFPLAIVLLTGIFHFEGKTVVQPKIAEVVSGEAADIAGLLKDDVILFINDAQTKSFEDVQRAVQGASGQALNFVVERNDADVHLVVTPRRQEVVTAAGTSSVGAIGIDSTGGSLSGTIQPSAIHRPGRFGNVVRYFQDGHLPRKHHTRNGISRSTVRPASSRRSLGRNRKDWPFGPA